MDSAKLAAAVRGIQQIVGEIIDIGENVPEIAALSEDLRDAKDLIGVLAHIVDGKTVAQAFGSPGDWGYETAIGKALASRG